MHRCIKSQNVPHVLFYRSSGTVSTGGHFRLTIYHTSVFCLCIIASQKATVTHISARRFQYRSLQGSNFRYRSHLHRTVSFCPKIFSSYNLNFEIFVTHIKAPLLSTPIDFLYILYSIYSVPSVSVCFTYIQ